MGERGADEDIGLRFFEDFADFFQTHSRVKNDGDNAEFQQG